ncbi:MAG: 4Fe-4S dicluster domain-containing protein [Desulfobacterales bacterium]|nr:4Fe-4S dicluster domain-containing protein [Desulfobacterales bacterium]
MIGYMDKIKEISERILKEGKVDIIVGFRKGSLPMMNEPCVVKKAEDVKNLVWDSNCGINLVNYLTNRKEKIGIIAKGCDTRNIVTHIVENKIKKEQLFIIGVPCTGMIDKNKVASKVDSEIIEVTENENTIKVKTKTNEIELNKTDLLQENCSICVHRNPVVYDELVAELIEEPKDIDRYASVKAVESMSAEEKWNYFEDLISTCIRCYACRNACPLCYCPTCFVDESRPQWVGKGQDKSDIRTFHFLRAFHCAGRCTDCGSCERACPMGIKVRDFTKKLEKDCVELFGWEAGMTLKERPPLDEFKLNDPEDFIY